MYKIPLSLWIAWLCLLFYGINAYADQPKSYACLPIKLHYKDTLSMLNAYPPTSVATIYFMRNKSEKGVWIDHIDEKDPHASAGFASFLKPRRWSAVLITKKNFSLSCLRTETGKAQYLDCEDVLDVCRSNIAMNEDANPGNYWLAENQPWDVFIKTVYKRLHPAAADES